MSGRFEDGNDKFVQLAKYVVSSRQGDAVAFIRRELPSVERDRPDLNDDIRKVMLGLADQSATRSMKFSGAVSIPADRDSKQELLWEDAQPVVPDGIGWPGMVELQLLDVVSERRKEVELTKAGVSPSRTLLFSGPPGVGKTLAAKWLAKMTNRPLITLDLASVMSSFLGRTGNNIRSVLDYARSKSSILLLDEFDAIAKRRDDETDVGELKRLVTVLLQAIDNWPATGILIAATNHAELLDPAVWRRFERIIQFPFPGEGDLKPLIKKVLADDIDESLRNIAAAAFANAGYADAMNVLNGVKRDSITRGVSISEALEQRLKLSLAKLGPQAKLSIAKRLSEAGATQRAIRDLTGLARDTLRDRGIATAKKRRKKPKS